MVGELMVDGPEGGSSADVEPFRAPTRKGSTSLGKEVRVGLAEEGEEIGAVLVGEALCEAVWHE